jgi:hypothetical protein
MKEAAIDNISHHVNSFINSFINCFINCFHHMVLPTT